MPSFFAKIFRRSSSIKSSRKPIGDTEKEKPLSRKELKKQKKRIDKLNEQGGFSSPAPSMSLNSAQDRLPDKLTTHAHPEDMIRKGRFNMSAVGSLEVSKSYSGDNHANGISHSHSGSSSGKSSRRSVSNHFKITNNSHSNGDADSDSRTQSPGPENDENAFIADFSAGFTDENDNMVNRNTTRLEYDHVQTFEKQHMDNTTLKPLYPQSNRPQQLRLPDGQLQLVNSVPNGVSSPMSAESEFDLSTDAEDNEYNTIRRTATNNLTPMLERSPSTSDDESIGLNTIRKNDSLRKNTSYLSSGESDTDGPQATEQDRRSSTYFSDSDFEPEGETHTPIGKDTDNLDFKHSHSGSTENSGSKDEPSTIVNSFPYEQKFDEILASSQPKKKKNRDIIQSPSSGGTSSSSTEKSLSTTLSPRTIAIQQAQNMRKVGKLNAELYPDSTDSEQDDRNRQYQHPDLLPPRSKSTEDSNSTGGENQRRRKNEVVIENFADFGDGAFGSSYELGSQSVADPTSPVSDLLRQAKERRNRRKEGSSVNSAPITNGYIQQRKPVSKREKVKKSPARIRADDASASASSAAKEKLRRRRYEKELCLKRLNNPDSDEGSGNGGDANESWLMEEVTAALGPRAIAADLESLGERSGLSKTSHRSRKGNRRNVKRSDESVGSRHSRHSRSSRYSHKSNKSQASIVSEHSRSVSNDLLRLEMQLARVGARKPDGDAQIEGGAMVATSSGSRPQSARSTQSRPQSSNLKRVKLTVVAPAGKLGIILANKTDAKGTVVSGVRTTSALADRISPGDRILEIDQEDVSRMTVSEITAIMTRQKDYERVLVVLTTAKDAKPGFTSHASLQGSDDNPW